VSSAGLRTDGKDLSLMLDLAQHKDRLRSYFDGLGYERWSAIYGDGPLSAVRRAIREGHTRMLQVADDWLAEAKLATGARVLDAGCGTGLFSLLLARKGLAVTAVDIAPSMVEATAAALDAAGLKADCIAADLEAINGQFALVACFDVLVHYPAESFTQLLHHLASLTENRLFFTYAPYSPLLATLHRIGGLFPSSQRRTEIQMIPEHVVRTTLANAGLRIQRVTPIRHRFYHVTLVEAVRD
jgi:magnesium-protoporphyrin O-methyltransferase